MTRRLILHIGMPKTGTTSIQRALHHTRGGADWRYLDLNPPHSANPVVLMAYARSQTVSVHPGPKAARTQEGARALVARALGGIASPRSILSAKSMFRMSRPAIDALVAAARPSTPEISAFAHVRPLLSFLVSSYQQSLKTAYAPPEALLLPARRPVADDVAKWDSVLGTENVTLRPFVRDALVGKSAVADFADALSLGALSDQDGHRNSSLSGEAVRLLVQYRRYNPTRHAQDGKIIHALMALSGGPFRVHPDVLRPALPYAEDMCRWAEERMAWHITEALPDALPRAIAREADFDDILPETLNWLAAQSDHRVAPLHQDMEAVAEAVKALRAPRRRRRLFG